jgi:surfeit locus 1 family protein
MELELSMRRLVFMAVIGLGGATILASLGVWQVHRLTWKEGLLDKIAEEISATPIPLVDGLVPEFRRYAPVMITGKFNKGYIRMLASRKSIGPVYRIIRPFAVDGYGAVLVDTGWQTETAPVAPTPMSKLSLIGNLDIPNEADSFTPMPDLTSNIWFARDVPEMAKELGAENILVVLRETSGTNLGVTAWPVNTAGISNDHLQYALTWFSLAFIWLVMTAFFVFRPNSKIVRKA